MIFSTRLIPLAVTVNQIVQRISKDEKRATMKSEEVLGPNDIPVEVWRCVGERAVDFLSRLFNSILGSERTP